MTVEAFGCAFASPVLLAAGSCGFGEPVVDVMSPSRIGGLVTKSVTVEPRWGNPAPRVAEFEHGMLNSVGLANPGLDEVRRSRLPWMRRRLGGLPVFVSVAGATVEEYVEVVRGLDGEDGFLGYELNLSCPNDSHRGGLPFCLDPEALRETLERTRAATERPLLAKLSPLDPDVGATAARAVAHGADGITAVNTMPGTLRDSSGRSRLGAGAGGTSGPALFPVGLAAARRAARAVDAPVVGVGGILTAADARAYLAAGATLVQVATASFADPRAPARIAADLALETPAEVA